MLGEKEPLPFPVGESRDNIGTPGNHDLPYRFRMPTTDSHIPFSTRQYARLLVLRGEIQEGLVTESVPEKDEEEGV